MLLIFYFAFCKKSFLTWAIHCCKSRKILELLYVQYNLSVESSILYEKSCTLHRVFVCTKEEVLLVNWSDNQKCIREYQSIARGKRKIRATTFWAISKPCKKCSQGSCPNFSFPIGLFLQLLILNSNFFAESCEEGASSVHCIRKEAWRSYRERPLVKIQTSWRHRTFV